MNTATIKRGAGRTGRASAGGATTRRPRQSSKSAMTAASPVPAIR